MIALALEAAAVPTDGPEERLRLVAAARAGDLAAFDLLMRQYQRLVLVTALRLLGNMEDAQDASQEVFLRFFRNLGKLERAGNLTGWLYRVTINVCHDLRRRRPAEAPVEEADKTPDQGKTHLSFKLNSKLGEEVVLYDPDGKLVDQYRWSKAYPDISFARVPDGAGDFVDCLTPTCGKLNGTSCGN